jgi:hypothetical protein
MRTLGVVLAATCLAIGSAAAQDGVPQHAGFWVGFGLGGGSNLTDGYDDARLGGSAYVRLGGTITQRLLVGGEAIGWARTQNGSTLSQGNVTASVLFYPARHGFYLKAGAGFASWSQASSSGNTTTTTAEGGFGATFGGGYDVRLGRNLYLTPNLDVLFQAVPSDIFTNTTGYLILFTLGLTWH